MGEPISSISPRRTMPVIYSYSAGIHQNQRITYERALRNLTVLMLPHGTTVGNAGSISRRSPVRMPTGTKYQQLPRTISDTSTVRHSHSWVMLKTWRLPILNSSDTVTTTYILMGGSLVICRQEGNCPLRSSQRKCTIRSIRRWSPGLKIALI